MGDGLFINFWTNSWLADVTPLIDTATSSISEAMLENSVDHYIKVNGQLS